MNVKKDVETNVDNVVSGLLLIIDVETVSVGTVVILIDVETISVGTVVVITDVETISVGSKVESPIKIYISGLNKLLSKQIIKFCPFIVFRCVLSLSNNYLI